MTFDSLKLLGCTSCNGDVDGAKETIRKNYEELGFYLLGMKPGEKIFVGVYSCYFQLK